MRGGGSIYIYIVFYLPISLCVYIYIYLFVYIYIYNIYLYTYTCICPVVVELDTHKQLIELQLINTPSCRFATCKLKPLYIVDWSKHVNVVQEPTTKATGPLANIIPRDILVERLACMQNCVAQDDSFKTFSAFTCFSMSWIKEA